MILDFCCDKRQSLCCPVTTIPKQREPSSAIQVQHIQHRHSQLEVISSELGGIARSISETAAIHQCGQRLETNLATKAEEVRVTGHRTSEISIEIQHQLDVWVQLSSLCGHNGPVADTRQTSELVAHPSHTCIVLFENNTFRWRYEQRTVKASQFFVSLWTAMLLIAILRQTKRDVSFADPSAISSQWRLLRANFPYQLRVCSLV
jgi:hypothetical protein